MDMLTPVLKELKREATYMVGDFNIDTGRSSRKKEDYRKQTIIVRLQSMQQNHNKERI